MGRRALILRSNPVAPDSRVEKEAAALRGNGYDIKILAWDRRASHKTVEGHVNAFGHDVPAVLFGHAANFGDGFKSLSPFLMFQWDLFRWLIANKNEYDLIHACDFDTAFTASIANIFLRKKLIFDIFDYIGGQRESRLQKILCNLHTWIINRADATIICTEERKRQIGNAKPKRLCIIHNTPPRIDVTSGEGHSNQDTKIKVCYVGILQDYRLLKEIPEFFIRHPEFEFHIGGFGKYEEFYKDLALKYPNIRYYGALKYQDTLKLETESDIMLAIYDPTIENHVFAAPNKFYESLMIGKPVVMVKGTGMSNIVDQYKLGEIINYSLESFEKGLLCLAARRKEWPAISLKMKEVYNQYSWDEMKRRLIALYQELI